MRYLRVSIFRQYFLFPGHRHIIQESLIKLYRRNDIQMAGRVDTPLIYAGEI